VDERRRRSAHGDLDRRTGHLLRDDLDLRQRDPAGGESFSHTFEEPGTYYYACTLHAEQDAMHAEVVVR